MIRRRGASSSVALVRARLRAVTRAGRVVLGLGALGWLVGWLFGWDEYMLVAAGCVLTVAAALLLTLVRSSLEGRLEIQPRRVTAGDDAVGRVEVTNLSGRMLLPVRVEAAVGEGLIRVDVPALQGGGTFEEVFVVPTTRRSVIPIGPLLSVRGDPLGLARRVVTLAGVSELFVHPRTVAIEGLTEGWIHDLEGRTTNDLSSSDVAFHTLRDYVAGDDLRHVHWRTTARSGRLMVRQFVDTRRAHLGLVLSTNSGEYRDPDDFELAASVAGSLGRSALRERQSVSAVAGASIVPGHTPEAFLDGLARAGLIQQGHSVQHTAARAQAPLRSSSVVFVVTGGVPSIGQVNAAADRFPPYVRVLAVRCAGDSRPGLTATGKTTVLDIGGIEQLPALLRSLGR